MSKLFVVLLMVFCHIVDDYYLQGWLASAKQKSWWEENAPEKKYKHDYIWALLMHSFSWAFMIMLPIGLYFGFSVGLPYIASILINCIIHDIVDNLKANCKKINLIQDQCCHLTQIVITEFLFLR